MAVMGGGALHVVVRFYAAVEQREGVRVRLERVDGGEKDIVQNLRIPYRRWFSVDTFKKLWRFFEDPIQPKCQYYIMQAMIGGGHQ